MGDREDALEFSALLSVVTDSAFVGATALQTSQQFDDLQKAVDAALRGKQIIDVDILTNIRRRRDEFVMECMPQASTFVREVQSFGIEFERAITVTTQSLQVPNSSDWKVPFRNLGRDVGAIVVRAQDLQMALKALRRRLKGDGGALANAIKPDPNPDFKKRALAAIVGGGLVAAIAVGIALALATGGTTYIVAAGVFKVAAGKAALGAAGVGACAGLLGGGAVGWYCKSVNDAKAKLLDIQNQIDVVISAVADLIGKWRAIKNDIERIEEKLGYDVYREGILGDLQCLRQKWHDDVIIPAQRLSIQD